MIRAGTDGTIRHYALHIEGEDALRELLYQSRSEGGAIIRIALAGDQRTLRLWDLDQSALATAVDVGRPLLTLAYNRQGTRLAVAGSDEAVRLLDAEGGAVRHFSRDLEHPVWNVRFDAGGSHPLSTGGSRWQVWSESGDTPGRTQAGHNGTITGAAYNHASSRIATVDLLDQLCVWDTSGRLHYHRSIPAPAAHDVAYTPRRHTPDHRRRRPPSDHARPAAGSAIGDDAPNIDCVALLRPTWSPKLFYQMVGRGFRLHPSKTNCLVLHFGGNVLRHGPVDQIRATEKKKGSGDGEAIPKGALTRRIQFCRRHDREQILTDLTESKRIKSWGEPGRTRPTQMYQRIS